jgi:hypothetical protein
MTNPTGDEPQLSGHLRSIFNTYKGRRIYEAHDATVYGDEFRRYLPGLEIDNPHKGILGLLLPDGVLLRYSGEEWQPVDSVPRSRLA